MQESFTDTIAFNQLFSGEIVGVIMEFKKKKIQKAGGQPIRQGGKRLLIAGAGSTRESLPHLGKKRGGGRGGEGGCDCNRGWAFEVRPRIRSFETSTCKFHAERRAHK